MRSAVLALCVGVAAFAPLSLREAHAGVARRQSAEAVDVELEKARQMLQQHEYFNALKGYQRANQLAGGKSADAFLGMALAAQGMKTFKNALDFAQSAVDAAGGSVRLLARAHKVRGQVYAEMADAPHSEEEFRAALTADPDSNVADLHYGLALALLTQHRDDEAIAQLKLEIEIRPHGTTAEEAQALIANPRRGREKYAPDFSFVAEDGQTISLDTLRGRVVLLDFWASSCGPCARALASEKKAQKDHSAQPFVIVSIGADKDERAWRSFIDKNGMIWPQYWDRDGKLQRLFDVQAIPTYVLLDAEGIERLRVKDTGFHEARTLAAEIDKQLKLLAQQPRP
jgi:tetratricopeptide (TPR) repeat protein